MDILKILFSCGPLETVCFLKTNNCQIGSPQNIPVVNEMKVKLEKLFLNVDISYICSYIFHLICMNLNLAITRTVQNMVQRRKVKSLSIS